MAQICCMSYTLAVKLIATYGLSLSILMINMLVSNFFSTPEEEKFIIALESWMLFGLNWTYVMKSLKVAETARTLLTCVLIYSALSLIANALLALGSLLKKPDYVLPWMYVQMISIIDQTISLIMQLTNGDPQENSIFYVPACSVYLLISSYFWMVVSSARRVWIENENNQFAANGSIPAQATDFNMPKTPSFLSSNNCINNNVTVSAIYDFSKPLPPAPPKYDIV